MNPIRRWLLALGVTLLLSGRLLLALPTAHAQSEVPEPSVGEAPHTPSWQQAMALIEYDRVAGILSRDEAALLRFTALTNWEQLPPQYQQTVTVPISATTEQAEAWHGAPAEQAAKFDALFQDYASWQPATSQTILAQMEQAEQMWQHSFNEQLTTTHFLIHWDSSGGENTPPGCTASHCPFVSRIALTLELTSWARLESYGYAMPEAAIFDQQRLDVYITSDTHSCHILPGPAHGAIGWPGAIKIAPTFSADHLPMAMTHELYHLVQWRYLGFHQSDCTGWLQASLWLGAGNSWLMEDTAMWAEHEVHGSLARAEGAGYHARVRDYLADLTHRPLFDIPYNGALFFRFLQEHIALHAGYSNTRDINLEVWQVLSDTTGDPEDKSTVEAMTQVIADFPPAWNNWQILFDDFARANYFKDYAFAAPLFGTVEVSRTVVFPIANPVTPATNQLWPDRLPQYRPSARYWELSSEQLNVAQGADATGATVELTFRAPCEDCTLDVLHWDASNPAPTLSSYPAGPWGGYDEILVVEDEVLAADFGAPTGTLTLTLILSNPNPDFFPNGSYEITATDNAPIAPTALTATTPPAGAIVLAWSPVHETGIRYVIERQDWQSTTTLGTVSTPTLGYTDQSAQVGTVYRYRVRALDTGGNLGPPTADVQALICPAPQPLLLVYLLDASSSMQERFVGSTSKLDAAKQAIHAGNALLRTWNNRSRAGLVVVQASPMLGPPHYRSLISPTTYHTAPTTNLTALETELARVTWYGNSPLAHALRFSRATLRNAHPADPMQRPVLLWLTDGQPTVSYEEALSDYWGYPFLDEDVQAVPLRDGTGIYRPISAIRASGSHYPRYDLYAGEPLADVMEASHDLRAARPAPTLHALEVQNPLVSTFEEGLLPYVADIGGGLGAAPATLDLLTLATLQALAQSACLPTVSPSPTATPTTPPGPRPTPTP